MNMSQSLPTNEQDHLRQTILSKCIWSDEHISIKHILKHTDNQLPLLVSFSKNAQDDGETILFFDRNISNKLLLTPLRQTEDEQNQFEVYPHHCTFAATELFKGLFEFIRDGQRCTRIFPNLEELVHFTTKTKCSVLFMSRDRVKCYFPDPESSSSKWPSKEYTQGSLFRAERIHRVSENRKDKNDCLECVDEEGYHVFLKMSYKNRYSLIANSIDQQKTDPEIYLHSTQTPNIGQLIKRLNSHNNNNCIRLVRGPVPYKFHCQYLRLVRQHTHDVLVGLTRENLVVEWNLESQATCRYATNLNDILQRFSGTWEEQLLETCIDNARKHYRENFQFDLQMISTRDWTAFMQYWKWTGELREKEQGEQNIPYQSRQRFHLVASIQDLTDDSETLLNELKEFTKHPLTPPPISKANHPMAEKKLTSKQKDFFDHISKNIESNTTRVQSQRISLQEPRGTSFLITPNASPFDNSTYDSNAQSLSTTTKQIRTHFHQRDARRTQ